MVRAVVVIGVSRTGNLQTLKAVHDGVRAMQKWAAGQGIDPDMIKVLSDEDGPVEVAQVKKAINDLVDLTTVQQLIVYFSGHGVNISRGEYWLLTGAPEDSNAAVNVTGSVELARTCGIRHVVFISDACRTAAEGIRAQSIRGSEIFPNVLDSSERPVDVFYAGGLGDPALEVKSHKKAVAGYRAVYTDSLVEALEGRRNVVVKDPDTFQAVNLIRLDDSGSNARGRIHLWPLSFYLQSDVLDRLIEAQVKPGVSQTPIARINSRDAWLAEVPAPAEAPPAPGAFTVPRVPSGSEELLKASRRLLEGAMAGAPPIAAAAAPAGSPEARITEPMTRIQRPFGPTHFEHGCGFKVRGSRFASAESASVVASIPDPQRRILSIHGANPAANVLIEFDGGSGMLLPAIRGYVAAIKIERSVVVNVSYEPVDDSPRWAMTQPRQFELRRLRALLAASARLGVLQLRPADAGQLLDRIQAGTLIDPTLALYAAYALAEIQQSELIRKIQESLRRELTVGLFDLALLAGELRGRPGGPGDLYPPVPLLAQGWALMRAHRVALPDRLGDLENHRLESFWTLFDAQGVQLIRSALKSKEID